MTMVSRVPAGARDAYSQLVRELQAEFDCADIEALAERIVESEAADFYWQARVLERYLGQYASIETDGDDLSDELARVACLSRFAGRWHVGTFLVDGEGQALDLLWKQSFDERSVADAAFRSAR